MLVCFCRRWGVYIGARLTRGVCRLVCILQAGIGDRTEPRGLTCWDGRSRWLFGGTLFPFVRRNRGLCGFGCRWF
jgi:hypothetical protein